MYKKYVTVNTLSTETFINITGCILGIFIIVYTLFICSAPMRFLLRIFLNSITGCGIFILLNTFFPDMILCPGINPITTVCVGILGIPGVIAVIIMCLI